MAHGITRRQALLLPAAAGFALVIGGGRARAGAIFTVDGLAIGGFDPVGYFDGTGPLAGRPDLTATWEGATWQFATAAHRDIFLADPVRWAPRYGGYCAFSMSRGRASASAPWWWQIIGDALYMFRSDASRERFLRDQSLNIRLADEAWPMVQSALSEPGGS